MSLIYSHQQTTSTTPTVTVTSLANARKLANKERRKAGREVSQSPYTCTHLLIPDKLSLLLTQRHEERKEESKAHEFDRKWERHERDAQRQEKRREDGTRAFTGRNLDNHRNAAALHLGTADTMTTAAGDHHHHHRHRLEDSEEAAYDTKEEVKFAEEQATSGTMLLAMARPAKTRRRRRCPPVMTDGEMFEIVEIDGRLVALDEDGWEILPDENAEVSLLYSDIVRGTEL